MSKYAIYAGDEFLRDVEALSEAGAMMQDPTSTRAVLISEQDEGRER